MVSREKKLLRKEMDLLNKQIAETLKIQPRTKKEAEYLGNLIQRQITVQRKLHPYKNPEIIHVPNRFLEEIERKYLNLKGDNNIG